MGKVHPFIYVPKLFITIAAYFLKFISLNRFSVDPAYVKAIIGNYSWYTSAKAQQELGYQIDPLEICLKSAVIEIQRKKLQLDKLSFRKNENLKRRIYESDDILLITGFPGWLGNRFVDVLMNGDSNAENAIKRKVRVFVQPSFKGLIVLPDDFEVFYGDLSSISDLTKALKGVTSVYHFAGVIYPRKIDDFKKVNTQGTYNLIDACIHSGVRRILFMSTDSVCGYGKRERIFSEQSQERPYKNYGKSKYLAEKYLLEKTREGLIDGTILRGFWFFGPFAPERNLNFFKMFRWSRQIIFGNGQNFRSISHVDNVIQAFLKAENAPATIGKWYWIGDEKPDYTVNEIYKNIADGMNVKFKPLYIPTVFCEILSWTDSILNWFGVLNPTIHAAGKFHLDIAGDISAAKRDFNYSPSVSFNEINKELKEINV
jgi:nucleoside-diphosphate-sugar epimerase